MKVKSTQMRTERYIIGCLLLIAGMMISCKQTKVKEKSSFPQTYVSAWEEVYGHCYPSINYAVTALDLYSEGLSLDTANNRMTGSGYNLYLSDIFVPDSLLEEGVYRSNTSAQPFTFLPGQDYEGTPHGMYLLTIENGKLQSIQVLDSGLMVVSDTTNGQTDLRFMMYYTTSEKKKNTYECHFQGPLHRYKK